MKEIETTNGYVTIVDDEDYEYLSTYKWSAKVDKRKDGSVRAVYPLRTMPSKNGKSKTAIMHRVIMKCPDGLQVDHINGDSLDNRKENLRVCTITQNGMNKRPRVGGFSGYNGVHLHKHNGPWRAKIKFKRKTYHLGLFENEDDAALAYNEAAIKMFGEYACLNVVRHSKDK